MEFGFGIFQNSAHTKSETKLWRQEDLYSGVYLDATSFKSLPFTSQSMVLFPPVELSVALQYGLQNALMAWFTNVL